MCEGSTDGFSELSIEDLHNLRDWLDLISHHAYQIGRAHV